MFDLERAIRDWKHGLEQAESVSPGNAEELEAHLREGIADLADKGLSRGEAFLVASARLGDHGALNAEYCKVNGPQAWQNRVHWMLFGYVGGVALTYATSAVSTWVGAAAALLGFSGAPAGAAAVVAAAACWAALLYALYARARRTKTPTENARAAFVLGAIAAFGGILAAVGRIVHVRVASVEQYGASASWAGVGGPVIEIALAAACIAMILATAQRTPKQALLDPQ